MSFNITEISKKYDVNRFVQLINNILIECNDVYDILIFAVNKCITITTIYKNQTDRKVVLGKLKLLKAISVKEKRNLIDLMHTYLSEKELQIIESLDMDNINMNVFNKIVVDGNEYFHCSKNNYVYDVNSKFIGILKDGEIIV